MAMFPGMQGAGQQNGGMSEQDMKMTKAVGLHRCRRRGLSLTDHTDASRNGVMSCEVNNGWWRRVCLGGCLWPLHGFRKPYPSSNNDETLTD